MFGFSDIYSLTRLYGAIVKSGSRIDEMIRTYRMERFRWYVKVFSSREEMSAALGSGVPLWVKAFSFRNRVCFLECSLWTEPEPNGYEDLLVHECAHCLSKARYGTSLPRWFDEGTAMYFAGQIGSTRGTALPPEGRSLTAMGYDEPMLYSYSALIMDSLEKAYGIGRILDLADDPRNFAPDGALGDRAVRELITNFKEK